MTLARIALLAAVLVAPGCAYATHVGRDFGESFHLGLGISTTPGVKVAVRASILSLVGAWMPDSYYVGSDHGAAFVWRERGYGFPFYQALSDRWWDDEPTPEASQEVPAYLVEDTFFIVNVPSEDARLDGLDPRMQWVVRGSQVEVGVHAVFVGASVGVNVAQFIDFLAALITFDPLGDDPAGGEST